MATSVSEKDKKKNIFQRVARSLKDMRGELKRVVWPSKKQAINNTVVVLAFMLVMAIFIGTFDTILSLLIRFFFGA